MNENEQEADRVIRAHLQIPTGRLRLRLILRGIELEIRNPGMRLTRRAAKCSTILRQEFLLRGRPDRLLSQYRALLEAHGVMEAP